MTAIRGARLTSILDGLSVQSVQTIEVTKDDKTKLGDDC